MAEIITVGLPFCAFKLLTGFIALHTPTLSVLGYALIALSVLDLAFNLVNLTSLAIVRRRVSRVCSTDFVVHRLPWGKTYDDLGIALDVFLSFSLVALVVGAGLLTRMPSWGLRMWNTAVVFNVLGAGIGRLLGSLLQRSSR